MALGVAELFYDPLSLAYDEGRYIAPIGGHSDHVHVSFGTPQAALTAIQTAKAMGLHVGENPYVGDSPRPGVHVGDSYHYRTFPGLYNGARLGQAIDVTGSSSQMAQFARWVQANLIGGSGSGAAPSVASSSVPAASPVTAGAGCGTVVMVLLPVLIVAAQSVRLIT